MNETSLCETCKKYVTLEYINTSENIVSVSSCKHILDLDDLSLTENGFPAIIKCSAYVSIS